MAADPPRSTPISGDCYQASVRNANDLAELKNMVERGVAPPEAPTVIEELTPAYEKWGLRGEIYIVHGWVTPPDGPAANKKVHHSWIEVGSNVIETQGGMRQLRSSTEYYSTFSVEVEERYTLAEANALVAKHCIYGRWTGRANS
jgi:hypothetical protein